MFTIVKGEFFLADCRQNYEFIMLVRRYAQLISITLYLAHIM